jgi:hypothetical protein
VYSTDPTVDTVPTDCHSLAVVLYFYTNISSALESCIHIQDS